MNYQKITDKYIAQGCNTYSKRADQYVKGKYPTHVFDSHKCFISDPDGKMYVDFVSGLGSNLLDIRNNFTLPHYREAELAARLCKIFPMDKLRFLKTGSEACQAAVRIARAYQSNRKQLPSKQNIGIGNGYHGWHNWCIASEEPGVGCNVEFYYKYNHISHLIEYIEMQPGSVGYCIIEPVMLDMDDGYLGDLTELRALCTKHDIVLIFDEVITGYRTPKYCMSNYLDIEPDLIVLGKAMANGFPLAVVGGKRKYMDTPDYFISSTHAGELSAIEEAHTVLDYLDEEKLRRFWDKGIWFHLQMNAILKPINVQMIGLPTRATWDGDDTNKALLWQEMVKKGYLFGKAFFLNFSHTEEILRKCLKEVSKVCTQIRAGKVKLKGEMPQEVFRRFQ